MSSSDFDPPTRPETLPPIVRDPTKKVVTRAEADRLLAQLEHRRHFWRRFRFFLSTFVRRLLRR